MKESPREFQAASAGVLSSLAFTTRKNDIKNLDRNMIIRRPKFLSRSLNVQKAKRGPIERQIAIVGSVRRKGFSGWIEQETGKAPEKKRGVSIHARRGSRSNVMKKRARLRPGNKFYKPDFSILWQS